MAKFYNNGNIKWTTVPKQGMTVDGMNELFDKLNLHKAKFAGGSFLAPSDPFAYEKCYWFKGTGTLIDIFIVEWKAKKNEKGKSIGYDCIPQRYYVRTTNPNSLTETSGGDVIKYMERKFKEIYNMTLKEAFGYSTELVKCIPKPLNETTRTKKVSPNVLFPFYKMDASSAYAFEASKSLPTMIDHKKVVGYVEPTAEFPFAFYPNEGKLAIYGEFNTNAKQDAKETVLCKAAAQGLAPIFEELYELKEKATNEMEKQYYKDIMNFFVGMLHYVPRYSRADRDSGSIPEGYKYRDPVPPSDPRYDATCPRFAALAAVIKERCNQRMLNLREEIEANGCNEVWLINTDAIGWVGYDMPHLYTTEKKLGNLILEHKNAQAIVLGSKKYQIKDEKGIETKWAGVPVITTQDMSFGDIRYDPTKCQEVVLNAETARFEYVPMEDYYVSETV